MKTLYVGFGLICFTCTWAFFSLPAQITTNNMRQTSDVMLSSYPVAGYVTNFEGRKIVKRSMIIVMPVKDYNGKIINAFVTADILE